MTFCIKARKEINEEKATFQRNQSADELKEH